MSLKGNTLYVLDQVRGQLFRVDRKISADDYIHDASRPARPYPTSPTCNVSSSEEPTIGDAIEHDPGYMNIAIPYDYGNSGPCHNPQTNSSMFNLDALLMAGHTCHRCLPEPCLNGGTCEGVQEAGFTCSCPDGFSGDMCQIKLETSTQSDGVNDKPERKDTAANASNATGLIEMKDFSDDEKFLSPSPNFGRLAPNFAHRPMATALALVLPWLTLFL